MDKFAFTGEGYLEAQKWLQEINEWEYISTHGFSTDGYSIVNTANSIWNRLHKD